MEVIHGAITEFFNHWIKKLFLIITGIILLTSGQVFAFASSDFGAKAQVWVNKNCSNLDRWHAGLVLGQMIIRLAVTGAVKGRAGRGETGTYRGKTD